MDGALLTLLTRNFEEIGCFC